MLFRLLAGVAALSLALAAGVPGQVQGQKKKAKPRPPSPYKLGPDSLEQKGVPQGQVIEGGLGCPGRGLGHGGLSFLGGLSFFRHRIERIQSWRQRCVKGQLWAAEGCHGIRL